MAVYTISTELEQIAKDVIAEMEDLKHLDDPGLRIAFQYSDQKKKNKDREVFADTETIKEKLKMFVHYDFLITFYEPNCIGLDEEHLKRLMYHELKHVGYDPEHRKFSIIPHDMEDFRDCVEKWGVNWIYSEGEE